MPRGSGHESPHHGWRRLRGLTSRRCLHRAGRRGDRPRLGLADEDPPPAGAPAPSPRRRLGHEPGDPGWGRSAGRRHLPPRRGGRRRALRRGPVPRAERECERHPERPARRVQARSAHGLQLDLRGLRPQPRGALVGGRRPGARPDQHRPLVLRDVQGGGRALLPGVPPARPPHHGPPLLQRLWAAARPPGRRTRDHDLPGAAPAWGAAHRDR